jgi:hypothetical protein
MCPEEQPHKANIAKAIIDSGATNHIMNNKGMFDLYSPHPTQILVADGTEVKSPGRGDVYITTCNNTTAKLNQTLFCPTLNHNLISIGQLDDKGYSSIFTNKQYYLFPNHLLLTFLEENRDQTILQGSKRNGLYEVDLNPTSPSRFYQKPHLDSMA